MSCLKHYSCVLKQKCVSSCPTHIATWTFNMFINKEREYLLSTVILISSTLLIVFNISRDGAIIKPSTISDNGPLQDYSDVIKMKQKSRAHFRERLDTIKNFCERSRDGDTQWAFDVDFLRVWHSSTYHFSACTVPKVSCSQ